MPVTISFEVSDEAAAIIEGEFPNRAQWNTAARRILLRKVQERIVLSAQQAKDATIQSDYEAAKDQRNLDLKALAEQLEQDLEI
jgi:hypothetical protein